MGFCIELLFHFNSEEKFSCFISHIPNFTLKMWTNIKKLIFNYYAVFQSIGKIKYKFVHIVPKKICLFFKTNL